LCHSKPRSQIAPTFKKTRLFNNKYIGRKYKLTVREQIIENRCKVFSPIIFFVEQCGFLKMLDFWWRKEKYLTIATLGMISNLYFIIYEILFWPLYEFYHALNIFFS